MTSWPWMQGVNVAIADPIPPVSARDKRPSVKALIALHRNDIVKVKVDLVANEPLFDATKHDDLWILRFVLSHLKQQGKRNTKTKSELLSAAVDAARFSIQFRAQQGLDKEDIRAHPPSVTNEKSESVKRYISSCKGGVTFAIPDPQRGVIGFLDLKNIDQKDLVEEVPESDWLPAFMYIAEWTFQWLDFISRTTGRLTKTIRIAETQGIKLGRLSREHQRRNARVIKSLENVYPQLLQKIYACNSPNWVQKPWRAIRSMLPLRVREKIDFLGPTKNKTDFQLLMGHIAEEQLPTRFGGQYGAWPVDFPLPSLEPAPQQPSAYVPEGQQGVDVSPTVVELPPAHRGAEPSDEPTPLATSTTESPDEATETNVESLESKEITAIPATQLSAEETAKDGSPEGDDDGEGATPVDTTDKADINEEDPVLVEAPMNGGNEKEKPMALPSEEATSKSVSTDENAAPESAPAQEKKIEQVTDETPTEQKAAEA